MIYELDDFIEELSELHPDVEIESLRKIADRGLKGINRIMRSGGELILRTDKRSTKGFMKLFPYMTPEVQAVHATRNYYRKKRRKEEEDAKNATNSK